MPGRSGRYVEQPWPMNPAGAGLFMLWTLMSRFGAVGAVSITASLHGYRLSAASCCLFNFTYDGLH